MSPSACSFVDNREKLNEEEIKFVEDPANAGLFNDPPPSEKKRTRDDQPLPDNSVAPAKRGKPSGDAEVSWYKLNLPTFRIRGRFVPRSFVIKVFVFTSKF